MKTKANNWQRHAYENHGNRMKLYDLHERQWMQCSVLQKFDVHFSSLHSFSLHRTTTMPSSLKLNPYFLQFKAYRHLAGGRPRKNKMHAVAKSRGPTKKQRREHAHHAQSHASGGIPKVFTRACGFSLSVAYMIVALRKWMCQVSTDKG